MLNYSQLCSLAGMMCHSFLSHFIRLFDCKLNVKICIFQITYTV